MSSKKKNEPQLGPLLQIILILEYVEQSENQTIKALHSERARQEFAAQQKAHGIKVSPYGPPGGAPMLLKLDGQNFALIKFFYEYLKFDVEGVTYYLVRHKTPPK